MNEARGCFPESIKRLPIPEGIAIALLCAYSPSNEIALGGSIIMGFFYLSRLAISSTKKTIETVDHYDPHAHIGKGKVVGYLKPTDSMQDLKDKVAQHGTTNIQIKRDKQGTEHTLLRRPFDED